MPGRSCSYNLVAVSYAPHWRSLQHFLFVLWDNCKTASLSSAVPAYRYNRWPTHRPFSLPIKWPPSEGTRPMALSGGYLYHYPRLTFSRQANNTRSDGQYHIILPFPFPSAKATTSRLLHGADRELGSRESLYPSETTSQEAT